MTLAQSFSLHALIVLFSVCVEAKATSVSQHVLPHIK